jgi:hypothetical protein
MVLKNQRGVSGRAEKGYHLPMVRDPVKGFGMGKKGDWRELRSTYHGSVLMGLSTPTSNFKPQTSNFYPSSPALPGNQAISC